MGRAYPRENEGKKRAGGLRGDRGLCELPHLQSDLWQQVSKIPGGQTTIAPPLAEKHKLAGSLLQPGGSRAHTSCHACIYQTSMNESGARSSSGCSCLSALRPQILGRGGAGVAQEDKRHGNQPMDKIRSQFLIERKYNPVMGPGGPF